MTKPIWVGGIVLVVAVTFGLSVPQTPIYAGSDEAALVASKEEQSKSKRVKAEAFLSSDRLPSGGTCRVAIVMDVSRNWHIRGVESKAHATTLKLVNKPNKSIQLKDVKFTKSHFMVVAGEPKQPVLDGRVYVTGTLEIPEGVSGPQELELIIHYQACDKEVCEFPMDLKLTGKIDVAPPGTVTNARNAVLFESLQ